jgi:nitrite reductase/ring-hydroxylating ferredoxin subunit
VIKMERDQFFDVGKIDEVPVGKMKYVEVSGNEIVVANVEGEK